MKTQSFGKSGEEEAEKFLKRLGYKVLAKNFHSRFGEIDIIAKDEDTIVFVEVKSRTSTLFGSPSEAIGKKKLQGIIKTAEYYLLLHNHGNADIRYDAIEVMVENGEVRFNHIKNITL